MPDTTSRKICVEMSELVERRDALHKIAKHLVSKPTSVYVNKHTEPSEFVWYVAQARADLPSSYEKAKFRTTVDNLYASYFEQWKRFFEDRKEQWFLEKAYLHFYRVDQPDQEPPEYLLLHSDPNENREHAIYKRGPHLHIHAADAPWPRAHIALNIGYLDEMLRDASSLTAAFEAAVVMIRSEILDKWKTDG